MANYCMYCGKPVAEDSDFCMYCGKPLPKLQTAVPAQSRPDAPPRTDTHPGPAQVQLSAATAALKDIPF